MASVVSKNAVRFSEGFLKHFSPEIRQDQAGLRTFLKLASEDSHKISVKKSACQLIGLLKIHPELKNLDQLNAFLQSYGSVTRGLKFLKQCSSGKKDFSLKEDLRALTKVSILIGKSESSQFPLLKAINMFSYTAVGKIASLLSELVQSDCGKSSIVLSAFCQAGQRMTDIQNCQLLELGIRAGQDAGEFFIQVAAALPNVSANEILLRATNSDKRLVDLVRSINLGQYTETLQAAA